MAEKYAVATAADLVRLDVMDETAPVEGWRGTVLLSADEAKQLATALAQAAASCARVNPSTRKRKTQ